jgi:hypothetical protein
MISALSQKSSLASSATAVSAGVVRTKYRKSRLGTPNASAALAMFPHDSAKTCFASSIEIFSQLGGTLIAGYRGIALTHRRRNFRRGWWGGELRSGWRNRHSPAPWWRRCYLALIRGQTVSAPRRGRQSFETPMISIISTTQTQPSQQYRNNRVVGIALCPPIRERIHS